MARLLPAYPFSLPFLLPRLPFPTTAFAVPLLAATTFTFAAYHSRFTTTCAPATHCINKRAAACLYHHRTPLPLPATAYHRYHRATPRTPTRTRMLLLRFLHAYRQLLQRSMAFRRMSSGGARSAPARRLCAHTAPRLPTSCGAACIRVLPFACAIYNLQPYGACLHSVA